MGLIMNKIKIGILMTLFIAGSQHFLLAPPEAEATTKAANPQFKVGTPEETIQAQQSIAQKALSDAKANVPKIPTMSDGTRNTTKTNLSTDITTTTKTNYNTTDGTTTHAVYQSDGSFQIETTHPTNQSSIKTTGNINTGEVNVKTVDATGSYGSKANVAEGTFRSDASFDMNLTKGSESHVIKSDGNTTTKTSYDTQNDTSTKTISNAQGKPVSTEVVDNNKNITTTTTFDPKTGNRLTSKEVFKNGTITTTYTHDGKKPLTEKTVNKKEGTTTTIEHNSDGTKNLTLKEADGTVTKATVDVNGKETTTSVVKSTSRIVDERQSQADSVKNDPVKAQKLVKDIAHDKGITLTDAQIEAKSQEFLSTTKSPGFFSDFIDSILSLFKDSSEPTKAQVRSQTALTNSSTSIDLFAKSAAAA